LRCFVPPFEVTILNHSPRLILAVPSKVSVQKMSKSRFLVFIFDPHGTSLRTTGQAIMMQDNVHAIVQIVFFESYFLGCTPQVKAQNHYIIDFFIIIKKYTIGIKGKYCYLKIPFLIENVKSGCY
jgi:hypothetical protein